MVSWQYPKLDMNWLVVQALNKKPESAIKTTDAIKLLHYLAVAITFLAIS